MPHLARTPDLDTDQHEAFVLRSKGHDIIRVWVNKGYLDILVSDLSGTKLKSTRGIAKRSSDGYVSKWSVDSYVIPRQAMMVATVFTDIDFSTEGPNPTPSDPDSIDGVLLIDDPLPDDDTLSDEDAVYYET